MLISSAFLSNTAWNAEALQNSSALATQLLPPAAAAPPRPAQPAPAHDINQDTTSHTSDNRESADLQDSSRTEGHNETNRRSGARAHRKGAHEAQRANQSDSTDATNSSQDANSQNEPAPFLAVLNDVLPPTAPVTPKSPTTDQVPNGPLQHVPASTTQNPPTLNVANLQTAAVPPTAGLAKPQSSVPANTSKAITAAESAASELNSSLEITKESATDPKNGINQKVADRGELAFAARVTSRTPAAPALNWNDAQGAIAASRFDASTAGSDPGAQDRTPQQPTQQTGQSDLKIETPAELSAQPIANDAAAAPNILPANASNLASASVAETLSRGTGSASVAAVAGSTAAAGTQNTPSSTPVAAGTNASVQNSDKAGQTKQTESGRAPEFLEPAVNEAEQKPTAGMRDISLRISNKDQGDVQVRLSERAGELRVSVRTPDAALGRGLRDGLSDLVGNLEHNGYRAETFQPASANASPSQDGSRDSSSQQNSQQQDAGNSGSGSGQQQNSRDHQQPEAPKWVGELESSLKRSNTPWLPAR